MNSIFQVKYIKPFTLCYISNKDREQCKPTGSNQKKIVSILAYSSHLCILIADLYSQTLTLRIYETSMHNGFDPKGLFFFSVVAPFLLPLEPCSEITHEDKVY